MPPSAPQPKLKLSRLRDIGWSLWDPIGILPLGEKWDEEHNQRFANEYDGYLRDAAGMLRRGTSDDEVIDYLIWAETVHMGMRERPHTRSRAASVVAAIKADENLWTYPDKGE